MVLDSRYPASGPVSSKRLFFKKGKAMGRNQPPDPPEVRKWSTLPPERAIGGTPVIVQTRRYHLLTPLFGGGVEAGVNDSLEQTLIRGSEIRGQLRFWWRAIRGWQWGSDPEVMNKHESEIWGAASDAKNHHQADENKEQKWHGVVQISITIQDKGQTLKPFEPYIKEGKPRLRTHKDIPEYAAFPLRPPEEQLRKEREQTQVNDLRKDIVFTLEITFAEQFSDDVQAALWAWETFGGVGARTRRGFGALQLESIDGVPVKADDLPPANPNEASKWIRAQLSHHLGADYQGRVKNIPYLEATMHMRLLPSSPRPADVWKQLIDPLRDFRQRRFDFKQQKRSPYGKSLWPEANALRRRLYPHKGGINTPDKFPRAAFGLPLVFHLAHERPVRNITLQRTEDEGERWASRLILKPLPCRGKQFLGLAAILSGSELPGPDLALMQDGKLWKTISSQQMRIQKNELTDLKDIIGSETDILQAFLAFLVHEEK